MYQPLIERRPGDMGYSPDQIRTAVGAATIGLVNIWSAAPFLVDTLISLGPAAVLATGAVNIAHGCARRNFLRQVASTIGARQQDKWELDEVLKHMRAKGVVYLENVDGNMTVFHQAEEATGGNQLYQLTDQALTLATTLSHTKRWDETMDKVAALYEITDQPKTPAFRSHHRGSDESRYVFVPYMKLEHTPSLT